MTSLELFLIIILVVLLAYLAVAFAREFVQTRANSNARIYHGGADANSNIVDDIQEYRSNFDDYFNQVVNYINNNPAGGNVVLKQKYADIQEVLDDRKSVLDRYQNIEIHQSWKDNPAAFANLNQTLKRELYRVEREAAIGRDIRNIYGFSTASKVRYRNHAMPIIQSVKGKTKLLETVLNRITTQLKIGYRPGGVGVPVPPPPPVVVAPVPPPVVIQPAPTDETAGAEEELAEELAEIQAAASIFGPLWEKFNKLIKYYSTEYIDKVKFIILYRLKTKYRNLYNGVSRLDDLNKSTAEKIGSDVTQRYLEVRLNEFLDEKKIPRRSGVGVGVSTFVSIRRFMELLTKVSHNSPYHKIITEYEINNADEVFNRIVARM